MMSLSPIAKTYIVITNYPITTILSRTTPSSFLPLERGRMPASDAPQLVRTLSLRIGGVFLESGVAIESSATMIQDVAIAMSPLRWRHCDGAIALKGKNFSNAIALPGYAFANT